MNRLISENDTVYSFDDFGNRVSMTDGTVTTNYTYDLNNRLLESNEVNGDITTNTKFFYDYNGNQISKAVMVNQPYSEGMSGDYTISNSSNNYIAIYEYNCYNQLVEVDTDGVISSYAYAPDGLRHSKTVGGNTTTFVYDNANVVEEITADGTNKYYRGIEIIKNDDNLYYIYNGQGDVAFLIDADGTTVADYAFDAYGNQLEENTIYNPFGYRGEYTDAENGLIYLRARMYDPQTGRFINEDPIKDGLNWYVYCENNSVMFVDPFGLRNIVGIAGSDYSSIDNAFYDDLLQFKEDNSDDNMYIFKAWEYVSWNDLVSHINKTLDGEKIDALVIAAHSTVETITLSNNYKRPERPNIYITKDTNWKKFKFAKKANIKLMGCNAGGMAGQKNMKTLINYDENGNFESYTGEIKKITSIAQSIANKTKQTVWAFTNYTSQNASHYQIPTDRYGERGIKFSLTTGMLWWKKTENIIGEINAKYTKFVK